MIVSRIARAPIAAGFRAAARVNLALRPREYRYIFILAHMRSGSSVLSHILTSHEDFVGAGETHTGYRTPADLPKLIPRTCQLLRKLQLNGTYLVDKITMDQYLSDEVLNSRLIHKCIILIRAPEGSLKSLIKRFQFHEKTALGVYVSRLQTLARYGTALRERALLVEYDHLLDRTEETLAGMTKFFGIDPPFKSNYNTHRATGKMGDHSSNIFAGRVFRTRSHEQVISPEVLYEASLAFRNCRRQLLISVEKPLYEREQRINCED
jgi:hypothetical protein